MRDGSERIGFPQAPALGRLRLLAWHNAAAVVRGDALPRPRAAALLRRLDADRRLVNLLDDWHGRYRGRPVWSSGLAGSTLVVLSREDVRRVLSASPTRFGTATALKDRTMGHFQPTGAVLSRGRLRRDRRNFNEVVLDWGRDAHREAPVFASVVDDEVRALLAGPVATGRPVTWRAMRRIFQRIGRRCVLGDVAAEDVEVSELLDTLRREGNWLGTRVWRRRRIESLRSRFLDRVHRYVDLGRPGSLVGRFADLPVEARIDPVGQVAQWLLAFDSLPAVAARTLALLATHPHQLTAVEQEIADADRFHPPGTPESVSALPHLRASALESARLWPVVRDVTRTVLRDDDWDASLVPKDAELLISLVYHGRAAYHGRTAHRFSPRQWLDGEAGADWGFSPAGRGPGACPGADLGLFLVTAALACAVRGTRFHLLTKDVRPDRPLPVTFEPYGVRFAAAAKPVAPVAVEAHAGPADPEAGF